jgi:hypothetical protein
MKTPIFYRAHGLWFLRIGGFILHAKDTRRHWVFYSERQRPAITVLGWRISVRSS